MHVTRNRQSRAWFGEALAIESVAQQQGLSVVAEFFQGLCQGLDEAY